MRKFDRKGKIISELRISLKRERICDRGIRRHKYAILQRLFVRIIRNFSAFQAACWPPYMFADAVMGFAPLCGIILCSVNIEWPKKSGRPTSWAVPSG